MGCVGGVCAVQPRCRSASLLRSLGRSLICPPGSAGGQAWSPALQMQSPLACPYGADASSSCMQRLFSHPARNPQQVGGYAPFPSFSRSVSTDYRLLTQSVKRFVLADKDCVFVSNFLFVGCLKKKMRTDKLFSLHSFITVTWFLVYIRGVRRFVPQCLITPPIKHRGSKGRLIDLLPDFVGSQNYHRRLKLTTSSVGRTLIRHCSTVLLFLCVSLWR